MAATNAAPDKGSDPVVDLLLRGRACTLAEAEEMYLEAHVGDVAHLVATGLSDVEFRRHPLIALLLARGSRGSEDSLT